MASVLKRKRGPVEALDTPKRSKSVKNGAGINAPKISENSGWDAAFPAPPKMQELVQTNGVKGDDMSSPDAVEYDEFDETWQVGEEEREKRAGEYEAAQKALKKAVRRREHQTWRLSEPIAGRMINVDPAFTPGEKFLIVANRTTVNVYATSNSLLHRSIKLKLDTKTRARIITYCLSPSQDNILWVACSDGSIFSVDWTTGAGADQYWGISSTGCIHMTVASMESSGRRRDVVFTTEARKDGGWRITANELAPPNGQIKTEARTIYTSKHRVNFLKTENEGSIIVAASENRVLIGRLRSTDYDTVDKIKYEFRVFESSDHISSLDLRVSGRTGSGELKKSVRKLPVVDLVVGDVKGAIFLHTDLLAKLVMSQEGTLPSSFSITPKRMHWHRQAVLAVKWSLDGNYVISGGSETVLVLWQLDTGKQHFLPHMTATIQNAVVSPSGSSYAIQLADNSAMIVSTAELEPTANIAGIQANIIQPETRAEAHVLRVEDETWGQLVFQRTPAVLNPADPSRLLLGVGPMQEMRLRDPLIMSNPFLQTFDLGTCLSLSRQAMTRTNVTNINTAPNAHRISEPRVTHMKISHDGTWLVTVDEWAPPERDLDFLGFQTPDGSIEQQIRREVFLKFWQWSKDSGTWELVSRIDAPHTIAHTSGVAGRVLDLAVDPVFLRFATIGEDEVVRTWLPRTRKRDGIVVQGKDGVAFKNWNCEHAISLGKPQLSDGPQNAPKSGCVAFSEDGSVLAATCDRGDGLLHLLDPDSGTVRLSYTGLFENNLLRMEFLGQDLITLSDKLNVYDLVSEDTRSSINLIPDVVSLSTTQKQEMLHLAVDRKSRTYAVTVPRFHPGLDEHQPKALSLHSVYSHTELVVFHQDKGEPQLKEKFPALVTALLPAVGSEGYIVLDTSAEIRTVLKKGSQAVTTLAQSTSALQLDNAPEEPVGDLMHLVADDAEELEEYQQPTPAATQEEADDDNDTPVVSQQQLSRIFDIGPSYALPPLEEMFYQVAGLFSGKPLVQSM